MENIEKRYQTLLASLSERFPSVQKAGFTADSYKPGLEGMRRLDGALGHPWKQFTCIHVAGTNGKGSVSSMLAAALHKAGYRTGLYTSPHLTDFRERMRIIGEGTPAEEEVVRFIERYDRELGGLSFFDMTTGMAFRWFADRKVDVAVIETGLGGRLDSTNIISPVLSIITSIGLDHCQILGDTRGKIACEKAGIFKPGSQALAWGRDSETEGVFANAAAAAGCRLHFASDTPPYPFEKELLSRMDLQGPCQEINLHTVLCALDILGKQFSPQILEGIRDTAALAHLRGRWERLQSNPEVICDIGHNPEALKMNFSRLRESGKSPIIVYGVMADKDWKTNIGLIPPGAAVVVTAPDTARALPSGELLQAVRSLRPELEAYGSDSVRDAVDKALGMAGKDSIIYIGGSTFVVAEAITMF